MPGIADAVKDPDFLKASVPDQMAYLAHIDPDFKTASSDDKLAYLNHVTGKAAPTTANNQAENASAKEGGWKEFGKGMLKAPLQAVDTTAQLINKIPKVGETLAPTQGVDALHQVATPSNESQQIGSTAANRLATWVPLGAEAGAAGAAGKLVPFAKRAATTLVGGAVGGEAGKYGGRYLGGETGGKIGQVVGTLAGGLAGGGAFGEGSRKIGNPRELPVVGKYLPDLLAEKAPVMSTEPYVAQGPQPPYVEHGPPTLYTAQGPPAPIPSVRRVPGEIAPEAVSSGAAPRMPTVEGPGNQVLAGGGGQIVRPQLALPPAPTPMGAQTIGPLEATSAPKMPEPKASVRDLAHNVVNQNIAPEQPKWQPNVSLRNQPKIVPFGSGSERPLSVGQNVSDSLNASTEQEAVRPLSSGPQKNMTMREIAEQGPPAEPVTHRATVTHEGKTFGMEAANGRKMYEATQDDTALAKSVHDMKNAEVTRAFTNAGGDVNKVGMEGQRHKVGKTTSSERAQQFDWMLDQGFTPREIVKLANQPVSQ